MYELAKHIKLVRVISPQELQQAGRARIVRPTPIFTDTFSTTSEKSVGTDCSRAIAIHEILLPTMLDVSIISARGGSDFDIEFDELLAAAEVLRKHTTEPIFTLSFARGNGGEMRNLYCVVLLRNIGSKNLWAADVSLLGCPIGYNNRALIITPN